MFKPSTRLPDFTSVDIYHISAATVFIPLLILRPLLSMFFLTESLQTRLGLPLFLLTEIFQISFSHLMSYILFRLSTVSMVSAILTSQNFLRNIQYWTLYTSKSFHTTSRILLPKRNTNVCCISNFTYSCLTLFKRLGREYSDTFKRLTLKNKGS